MLKDYENKKLKIEIKRPLKKYAAGQKIKIDVDKDGKPKQRYWRDRLIDSKTDGCIEIIPT